MNRRDYDAWLRALLQTFALAAVLVGLSVVVQELRALNAHLATVEAEVRKNTETQERMERLATNTLKSFGNGIE